MAVPQIDAITVTPSRQNPATFSADTDQFLSEVPSFQTQANAQADFNNSLALQVQSNSDLVALNTQATVGAANFKGIWADATGAATKGDSYYNSGQFFALNVGLADITASEPLVGSADWSILSQGVFDYVVSQFAGGDKALVGYIYAGVVVTAFDYLIYPLDGRVYSKNGAVGTLVGDFNPSTGIDSGLSKVLIAVSGTVNKEITVNIPSDSNFVLTESESTFSIVRVTDSGAILTGSVSVIVSDLEKDITVYNDTSFDLTVKTLAGTGILVKSGYGFKLRCDGTNVILPFDHVVEIGSNANGSWGKWASLRMEQSGLVSADPLSITIADSGSFFNDLPVTFPTPFSSTPKMVGCGVSSSSSVVWGNVNATTAANGNYRFICGASVSPTVTGSWLAVGEWA